MRRRFSTAEWLFSYCFLLVSALTIIAFKIDENSIFYSPLLFWGALVFFCHGGYFFFRAIKQSNAEVENLIHFVRTKVKFKATTRKTIKIGDHRIH